MPKDSGGFIPNGSYNRPGFKPGEYLLTCDRTGFVISSSDARREKWSGKIVHKDFYQEQPEGDRAFKYPTEKIISGGFSRQEDFSYLEDPTVFYVDPIDSHICYGTAAQASMYGWEIATAAQLLATLPTIADQTFSLDSTSTSGAVVGSIVAEDPDDGTLTYEIISGNTDNIFTLNTSSGILYVNLATLLALNGSTTYTLVIRVTDNSTCRLFAEGTITINSGLGAAPSITSTDTVSLAENLTTIQTCTADTTVTWSIIGGLDSSLFSINSSTGALTFASAPNYESPTDSNTNNVYNVEIKALKSDGQYDTQTINVTITNADEIPTITSASTASVAENVTTVMTCTATDPDSGDTITWSLSGGDDKALFQINSSSGLLEFKSAPDYETPLDVGTNNVYNVEVKATGTGGLAATQAIAVTVTEVVEWDPTAYGTAVAIWDAMEAATDITVTGLGVSSWLDRSGNSHTLVQTTDADRPSYSAACGFRGIPGVIFERSSTEFLVSSEAASTWNFLHDDSGHTIIMIMEIQNLPATNQHAGILATEASTLSGRGIAVRFFYTGAGAKQFRFDNNGTTDETYATYADTFTNSHSLILSTAYDKDAGGSDDGIVYIDGVAVTNGNITRTLDAGDATSTLCMGTIASDTTNRNANMIMHACFIYTGKLSAATQLSFYNAAIVRYGSGGTT